jgi:two-component system cell cycle response regulator CtrA
MRILVIEPHAATAQSIELMLKSEGFNPFVTNLGEDGRDLARRYDYDIILMELTLSDISGYEVLRSLRDSNIRSSILILSNKSDIETKVKCLNAGADDYMTKPFHKDELVARVNAVVRRAKGHAQSKISINDIIVLNIETKSVVVKGNHLNLTRREYEVLEFLCMHTNRINTPSMILSDMYGGLDEPDIQIIDVFVSKLRRKLAAATNGDRCIETVRGRGYLIRDSSPTH